MNANRPRTAARRLDRPLLVAALLLLVSIVGMIAPSSGAADAQRPERFKILVFTKTAGFFHPSIPTAIEAIEELGARNGFAVDATTDAAAFTPENLAQYSALVFVSTTGNVLPEPSQRAALEGYIRAGGGFLGVHAASDMGGAVRDGWPFYRQLVGAAFLGHTRTHVWADAPVPGTVYEGPLEEAPADAESFGDTVRYRSWEPALVNVEDVRSPAMRGWGHTAGAVSTSGTGSARTLATACTCSPRSTRAPTTRSRVTWAPVQRTTRSPGARCTRAAARCTPAWGTRPRRGATPRSCGTSSAASAWLPAKTASTVSSGSSR